VSSRGARDCSRTSEIRLANRNANRVLAEAKQDRLVRLSQQPPSTSRARELAERRFTAEGYAEDENVADAALAELREAARTLAAQRVGH
jgi:hypothetical protein